MIDSQTDDISGSAPGNAPVGIAEPPLSVGAVLREARTRLGLGVADVANRLKFAPRQIEALEEDNFARLPEMAFVRGFVRSYARLLQLDPVPLLDALPGAAVQLAPQIANTLEEIPFPNVHSARKSNFIWLAAALAVAVALVLFAWLHGNTPNAPEAPHVETLTLPATLPVPEVPVSAVPDAETMETPQVAAPAVQQAAVPLAKSVAASAVQQATVQPAKPAAAIGASIQAAAIRLVFDEESWAEVTDKDGKTLLSQLNSRGSEQSINGTPPFSVVIGRASGVHLYYKGQAVKLAPHTNAEVARLTLE